MSKSYYLAFLVSMLIGANAEAKPPVFMTNYESAKKVSKNLGFDVLVIFSADWCKYCKTLKKDLSKDLSVSELQDLIICIVDVDSNPQLKRSYQVSSIPDSVYLSKNKVKSRRKGYNDLGNYLKWLKSNK